MSKRIKKLNTAEIAQVAGGQGEIANRYLGLRSEDTKSGEIEALYLGLRAEKTKSSNI